MSEATLRQIASTPTLLRTALGGPFSMIAPTGFGAPLRWLRAQRGFPVELATDAPV